MRKIMTGLVLAGLIAIPIFGQAAETATPVERAAKAAAFVASAAQKGADILAAQQKALDQAKADVAKAEADLKLAEASGDKAKIKDAADALRKAKLTEGDATDKVRVATKAAERLKVLADQAKLAADKANDPKEAEAAANEAEVLAVRADRILKHLEAYISRPPKPPLKLTGITIPTTTTSTTQPSPTPVGRRG